MQLGLNRGEVGRAQQKLIELSWVTFVIQSRYKNSTSFSKKSAAFADIYGEVRACRVNRDLLLHWCRIIALLNRRVTRVRVRRHHIQRC